MVQNWLKSAIINEYRRGENGYKKIAKKYNLTRDNVRDVIRSAISKNLIQQISVENKMKDDKTNNHRIKDIEYYETATAYWENYAKLLEKEIEKKRKKKLKIQAIKIATEKNQKIKTRMICQIADITKSTYYFNYKNDKKEIEDMKVISLIGKLPDKIKMRAGNKTKSEVIKQRFGIVINHKRMERIFEIIEEQLHLSGVEVTEEASFKDDLGADSLDVFQIIMGLEEEFDIEIPPEKAEKITTVGEAVELIKNEIE